MSDQNDQDGDDPHGVEDIGRPWDLESEEIQPAKGKRKARRTVGPKTAPELTTYIHPDRRLNNPEVGIVNAQSDPDQPVKTWAYDPHIDPALQFDSQRSAIETLIDDALASGDAEVMHSALAELKKRQAPYLNWAGKAEHTSFEVDTVSLHVHERIDPATILAAIRKQVAETSTGDGQPWLFDPPFEALPLRQALDFYGHEKGWANRLVAGDSLLVMNSLLQKEGMAGQFQTIYIDPPYGVKYGSNFQAFTNKRDVKDRVDADLTQEPEMVKAFRDTWELGIHSYLTYLRDRLILSREMLTPTGSIFVQISDENVHLVRNLMDEIFGSGNFCSEISFRKTSAVSSPDARVKKIATVSDIIVWYAFDKSNVAYNQLYMEKNLESDAAGVYVRGQEPNGRRRRLIKSEKSNIGASDNVRVYRIDNATSTGYSEELSKDYECKGKLVSPGGNKHWKTTLAGLERLEKARRVEISGATLGYVRFIDDFAVYPMVNYWPDTGTGSFTDEKVYVVQTAAKAVERCILMTSKPGELVFDPTCGSGTTAYVAEKWGRRWITCDTSRVSVALAKQRLMTSSFEYYPLRYPSEGLRGEFLYRTVPHITLKSIANNDEIDLIYSNLHPAIESALADLNLALQGAAAIVAGDGGRKGQKITFDSGDGMKEWEVPFDWPVDWPQRARAAFDRFHKASIAMQRRIGESIAARAENETLYDKPAVDPTKLRVTGPFTVEAVPSPIVGSLDRELPAADASIARSGETIRQSSWRDELLKSGIRGKGGQMLRIAGLEVIPGCKHLHASGALADDGSRVVVSFGPEHAALEQRQVERALEEAAKLIPVPKLVVFCAFTFDPEAAKDIDEIRWPGVTLLKAQMNTDLLTEDLKKARSSNQSFWLMGQPDVDVQKVDGCWQVQVNGFDYFDTKSGELVSGGTKNIAMWSLDTDYDGRAVFPRQTFFPMAGAKDGWNRLKANIKAELDADLLDRFHGAISLPFDAGEHKRIAVKIVDDRGIESLKIVSLDD